MTIVLTGGGSGGHITPIQAVAKELKKLDPKAKIVYIGLKGDVLTDVASDHSTFDEIHFVRAGKFRRYHSAGWKQILDLKTQYLNFRDFFLIFIGLVQSYKLMRTIRPNIVFSRGGFVIVPVCIAAKLNKIPYITHDSDSIPSLANRIIARWAKLHFVALPKETYQYDQDKTVTTGIPINKSFVQITDTLKQQYREKLKIPKNSKLLFITGGGLGATSLNRAVTEVVPHLINEFKDLFVVHLMGIDKTEGTLYDESIADHVKVIDFTNELYLYSGAADVIVCRAGATNLAEFAVQGKGCILIPSSYLVAGHQLDNADILEKAGAAKVITDINLEEDPNRLAKMLSDLFKNPKEIQDLEGNIAQFARPDATSDIATRLLKIVENDI
jgi:UDP-N-acetylglucosamine--N-acetylmuramyl-(pentapeptide) pyrophosphoryl-undecaprenol N-acetylglucosamine transferase